jgi:hypothetical protein
MPEKKKPLCDHVYGFNEILSIFIDEPIGEPEPGISKFNFCPYCGTNLNNLIVYHPQDDCQRGGCED